MKTLLGNGGTLSCAPSAVADAGNGRPLSWVSGGSGIGRPKPSAHAVAGNTVWQDTRLLVPGIDAQWHWRNVLTGEPVVFALDDGQPALAMAPLLAHFPVALLMAHQEAGQGPEHPV